MEVGEVLVLGLGDGDAGVGVLLQVVEELGDLLALEELELHLLVGALGGGGGAVRAGDHLSKYAEHPLGVGHLAQYADGLSHFNVVVDAREQPKHGVAH